MRTHRLSASGSAWRWLKRRLPTSLFGRSLLIIVLPIAVMQIAVTWAFFDAHWHTVNARLAESLAGDVAWIDQAERGTRRRPAWRGWRSAPNGPSICRSPSSEGGVLPHGRRRLAVPSVDQSLRRALDRAASTSRSGSTPPAILPMSTSA